MSNFLDAEIELCLINNKQCQRVREQIRIVDRRHLSYIKDRSKLWLEYEPNDFLKPDYCDTLTLHCTKNGEYILFTTTVFRFGTIMNLGWIRLSILCSSRGGFEKRRAIKFRYQLDDSDKESLVLVITGVLAIMCDMEFNDCSNSIDVLFPSSDLSKND